MMISAPHNANRDAMALVKSLRSNSGHTDHAQTSYFLSDQPYLSSELRG